MAAEALKRGTFVCPPIHTVSSFNAMEGGQYHQETPGTTTFTQSPETFKNSTINSSGILSYIQVGNGWWRDVQQTIKLCAPIAWSNSKNLCKSGASLKKSSKVSWFSSIQARHLGNDMNWPFYWLASKSVPFGQDCWISSFVSKALTLEELMDHSWCIDETSGPLSWKLQQAFVKIFKGNLVYWATPF